VYSEADWHWKTVFRAVAESLDKSAEVEEWMQAYDERAAKLGALLPEDVVEVSIVRWMADGPRILLSNAFSSQVLSDVGFARPQYQLDLAGTHPVHTDVISMEQVELVDADIIFAGGLNPEGDIAMEEALADPLVQTLTAVQSNRLFVVDGLAWSSTGGPVAALEVLDDVENALAELGSGETAAVENAALPRTVTDVNGAEVIIEDDSAVVSLDGPLTEIVYALGAEDRLVTTALGKEAEGEEIVAQMEVDLAEAADLLAQTEGTSALDVCLRTPSAATLKWK
jgi:ABC-type Fe3+-hydroxamate transport system substrate-binding protein